MKNLDQLFKEKLQNIETPLSDRVSFEKVMARRNKPVAPIWWKPALLVVATLSVVSLTAYFLKPITANHPTAAGLAVQPSAGSQNPGISSGKGAATPRSNQENAENTGNQTGSFHTVSPDHSGTQNNNRRESVSGTATTGSDALKTDGAANPAVNTGKVAADASRSYKLRSFGLRIFGTGRDLDMPSRLAVSPGEVDAPKPFIWPSTELMINTGGRNYDFSGNNDYTVRGNHYFGQYSAIALWDMGKGIQLGAGLGFGQFMGNGEWRSLREYDRQHIDTQTITIVQPGLPNKVITVYDTTTEHIKEVQTGNLNYRMNKVSLPLAFRWHLGQGRTLWRISGTVSPGMLSMATGRVFNQQESLDISAGKQSAFTLDARLGVGFHYLLSRRVAVVAEPGLMYQSVTGQLWKPYDRVSLGFGLGVVIKP